MIETAKLVLACFSLAMLFASLVAGWGSTDGTKPASAGAVRLMQLFQLSAALLAILEVAA